MNKPEEWPTGGKRGGGADEEMEVAGAGTDAGGAGGVEDEAAIEGAGADSATAGRGATDRGGATDGLAAAAAGGCTVGVCALLVADDVFVRGMASSGTHDGIFAEYNCFAFVMIAAALSGVAPPVTQS